MLQNKGWRDAVHHAEDCDASRLRDDDGEIKLGLVLHFQEQDGGSTTDNIMAHSKLHRCSSKQGCIDTRTGSDQRSVVGIP